MDTYGDMVTLLLTFFVLLFSFSTIDAKKWEDLVSSFTGQRITAVEPLSPGAMEHGVEGLFVNTPSPARTSSPLATGEHDSGENIRKKFDELYERIQAHIAGHGLEAQLEATHPGNTILLRMKDSMLFDSGSHAIKPGAEALLQQVVLLFNQYGEYIQEIRIEGHTDNVPIGNAPYQNNMELSTQRAASIWTYLVDRTPLTVSPGKLTAQGRGEFFPVAGNDTDVGRSQNRRVDFILESITSP